MQVGLHFQLLGGQEEFHMRACTITGELISHVPAPPAIIGKRIITPSRDRPATV